MVLSGGRTWLACAVKASDAFRCLLGKQGSASWPSPGSRPTDMHKRFTAAAAVSPISVATAGEGGGPPIPAGSPALTTTPWYPCPVCHWTSSGDAEYWSADACPKSTPEISPHTSLRLLEQDVHLSLSLSLSLSLVHLCVCVYVCPSLSFPFPASVNLPLLSPPPLSPILFTGSQVTGHRFTGHRFHRL
jgi:hypothetical protein